MSSPSRRSFRQHLERLLYPIAKRFVHMVPAWLIRVRPFGIYEVKLAENNGLPSPSTCPDRGWQVRWVASREEARLLHPVAAAENIAGWNGAERRAAAVWQEDQPLGVAWIAADSFCETELGLCYRMASDEEWLYAAVVQCEFRRKGVYRLLWQFLFEELRQSPTKRLLLGVSDGNRGSQLAHLSIGATRIGDLLALKVLRFGFCKTSGAVHRESSSPIAIGGSIELSFG